MAAAAIRNGLSIPFVVTGCCVATLVPTTDAKPNTIAGATDNSPRRDACIISALPIPTHSAAIRVWLDETATINSVVQPIAMPVMFDAMERIKPSSPPPSTNYDAQAMNVTHTGT